MTNDLASRARRAAALRAKAASTTFDAERDVLIAKAEELDAKNVAAGYVAPRDSLFTNAANDLLRAEMYASKLARYKEWLAQTTEARADSASRYADDQDAKQAFEDLLNGMFGQKTRKAPRQSRTPAERTRTSHTECYAEGRHANSPAGRAACRKGRV